MLNDFHPVTVTSQKTQTEIKDFKSVGTQTEYFNVQQM